MKNLKNIFYMLGFVWKADKGGFAWKVAYMIWVSIPTALRVLILKLIIDAISEQKPLSYIVLIVLVYSLVQLISNVFSIYVHENRLAKVRLRVQKYSNNLLLNKCAALDMECYDDTEFYDKLSRALGQVNSRAMDMFDAFGRFMQSLISFLVGISIILTLDPLMIIVAIIGSAATGFINFVWVKQRFEAREEMVPINRKVDYFHGLMRDRKTVSDVKQYNGFGRFILGKYSQVADTQIEMQTQLNKRTAMHNSKQALLSKITLTMFPYLHIAVQCFRGVVSVADVTAVFNAFTLATDYFMEVTFNAIDLKEGCLYAAHLREVLDYEPKIERNEGREIDDINEIRFENVSFKYPHSDNHVLKNLSITIKKGQKIAIVGINGAGKTTFVKLLMRYYDPCEGRVLVNGVDLKEYNVNSLRDKMATLLQEFQPYNVPIDEMIACSETTDEQKVERVLAEVGLTERVNAAPKKIKSEYSKMFDEDGVVFSGGELQKLFIARMRYKDGGIYIMDEPSSALDPIAEYEINNLMMSIAKDKTVVMIAHRLSTVVNADCILLIDGGKVLEMGSHKQLLEHNGKYAQMFNLQAEQYQTAKA